MTPPLSRQTYSTRLIGAATPALHGLLQRAGRRLQLARDDDLTSLRSLLVALGPGGHAGAVSIRATIDAARQYHGPGFPVQAVLLPGSDVPARRVPELLDLERRPLDLRAGVDDGGLQALLAHVPIVSGPTRSPGMRARDPLLAATIASYDAIAERFAAVWEAHAPLEVLEAFVQRLPARASVLDAGCGPGHHAHWLARRGHRVLGIDLSQGMLRLARARRCGVRFARRDLEDPQLAERFDGIWCAASAMHVPRERMPALLMRWRGTLVPGGLLGLSLQVGRPSEVAQHGEDRRFFEYYRDGSEIAALLHGAGFALVGRHYGETARNTHGAAITLRWQTTFARAPLSP